MAAWPPKLVAQFITGLVCTSKGALSSVHCPASPTERESIDRESRLETRESRLDRDSRRETDRQTAKKQRGGRGGVWRTGGASDNNNRLGLLTSSPWGSPSYSYRGKWPTMAALARLLHLGCDSDILLVRFGFFGWEFGA